MSSFAKAQKAGRKTHKERSQVSHRRKFGFLEKSKDWKLRREDFHFKQRRLKALAEKARNRNPDEFYFAMVNKRTQEGVHKLLRPGQEYTQDEMFLLKTQDANYIQTKLNEERRNIERLQSTLHMTGMAGSEVHRQNTHTIFLDEGDDKKKVVKELKKKALAAAKARRKLARGQDGGVDDGVSDDQAWRYEELASRVSREDKLLRVHRQLETQRNLMGKGRKKKIVLPSGEVIYKWARERKK